MNENLVPPSNPDINLEILQDQISHLQEQLDSQKLALEAVNKRLPETNLISPNFLKRAFTVWGHYVVAGFLISIPFMCLGILFALVTMLFSQQVGPPLN
jgi:hypothetical protein